MLPFFDFLLYIAKKIFLTESEKNPAQACDIFFIRSLPHSSLCYAGYDRMLIIA